jgi:osmoprotectant transport system permease protein
VRENAAEILALLREHIWLTGLAVLFGGLIAIPLGIIAYRSKRLTGPVLGITGVLYTIPSLALFGFLAPYTGITAVTVLIGLTLYALLVISRNTLAGLRSVPAEAKESAEGMGYGPQALLWRVEMPLALPGIITGLRLATVSTVALVTVGVIVGHGGLGQLILGGFQNNFHHAEIATGAIGCLLLALVLDLLFVGISRFLTPWLRR